MWRSRVDSALLILRVVYGIIFLAHGLPKLAGLALTTEFFGSIGIPLPGFSALLVGVLEVVGGIGLMAGVGTRIFAMLLAIQMLVAIFVVKLPMGLVGGYELDLALFAGMVALALTGAGQAALFKGKMDIMEAEPAWRGREGAR